jgi:hypothetical protein
MLLRTFWCACFPQVLTRPTLCILKKPKRKDLQVMANESDSRLELRFWAIKHALYGRGLDAHTHVKHIYSLCMKYVV